MPRPGRWGAGVAVLLLGTLTAAPAPTAPRSPGDALSTARLVEAALNSLTGLVASFTQTVESPGLPSPQVEKGTLYLLPPGRMRWEYSEPPGKLAIADGRRSYLYLPEERQVLVAPLDAPGAESGVALLLGDPVSLVEAFEIGWSPEPADGGSRRLKLTPRAPRAQYQSLVLEPDEDHLIRALVVVDALGGTVTYRFSRQRRVDSLPESLFRFTPPRGAQVQEIAP
jgi:outer membrane lipoprotein carrier protein